MDQIPTLQFCGLLIAESGTRSGSLVEWVTI
jgi:hypothetical protein